MAAGYLPDRLEITYVERVLSDGSKVYDVEVPAFTLACATENDAQDRVWAIEQALDHHGVVGIEVGP